MRENQVLKEIEGNRVRLRPIELENILEDAQNVVSWANNPEVREALRFYSFFQGSLTLNRQLYFFYRMIESKNDQVFIVETKSGEFLGTCGLHDIDRFNNNLRFGIIIFNKNYLRKGYGKEILNLLLRFSFENLGMNKVYLTPRTDNKLAIYIYKRLGFKKEGIMRKEYKVREGQYIDPLRMSILRDEWEVKRLIGVLSD